MRTRLERRSSFRRFVRVKDLEREESAFLSRLAHPRQSGTASLGVSVAKAAGAPFLIGSVRMR